MAEAGLICLGAIVKPHGIRGECVADVLLEDKDILGQAGEVYVLGAGEWRSWREGRLGHLPPPRAILALREHKGRLLLLLRGVEDRDAAEALRGLRLCLPESALPPLDEDEVYCHQLVGCHVLLRDGTELGVLRDVDTPTEEQEIWTIETDAGEEVLFPAHPETVLEIDIEARTVRIAPPEGLLEIYLQG